MPFIETHIPGLMIFEPKVFEDKRGYFYESFNKNMFTEAGIEVEFVQDNQSKSSFGVLRGLHYQLEPKSQAKLVRVLSGEVLDVVVDLRKGSPTYYQAYSLVLSTENRLQLYIPKGFAHGFIVLSDSAEFFYKCDEFYSKEHEEGIIYNDPSLGIDWNLDRKDILVSEKDAMLPVLPDAIHNFEFQKA